MMMNDERIVGGEDAPSPIPWQVKSWWSRTTPFATISFKKSYKIFHHILLYHDHISNFKEQGKYFYLLQFNSKGQLINWDVTLMPPSNRGL